ncbi:MAG: protein kinase [Candidatus Margulisiibacteriota bacterium]
MKSANEIYRNWAPGKFYRALQANGAGGGQDLKAKTAAELAVLLTDVERRRANATPANLAKFDAVKAQIVQAQKFVVARNFYQEKQNINFTDLSESDYVNNHQRFDRLISEHINNVEAGELKTNLQKLQAGAKQQVEARQFYDEFKEHSHDDFAALTNPAAFRTRADLQIGKAKGNLRTEIERLKAKAETARAAKAFIDQYKGYSYDDFAKLSDPAAFRTKAESQIGKVEGNLKTEIERLKAKAETADAAKDFHKKYRGADFGKLDLAGYSEFITNIDEQIDKVGGSNLGTDLTALKAKAEKDRAEAAKKTVEAKRPPNGGRRRADRGSDSRIDLKDEDIDASEPDIYVGTSKKYHRQATPLGEGGIGKVYAAEELSSRDMVAIKELHFGSDAALTARLFREFEATNRIESEHIVRGLDSGKRPDGAPFIVMELLTGRDLSEIIKEKAAHKVCMLVDELVPYLLGVIDGLKAAAVEGITHRDIKPQNIYIEEKFDRRAPANKRAVILDFGLAKIIEDGSRAEAGKDKGGTKTGQLMGTLEYMAPEIPILTGPEKNKMLPDELLRRYILVDIYALGILAYKCLMNKVPFSITSPIEYGSFAGGFMSHDFPAMGDNVPPIFQKIAAKMIAFDPKDRYQDYDELELDINYAMFKLRHAKFQSRGVQSRTIFSSIEEMAAQPPVTVRHQPAPGFNLIDPIVPTSADQAIELLQGAVRTVRGTSPTDEQKTKLNQWILNILENESLAADDDITRMANILINKLKGSK